MQTLRLLQAVATETAASKCPFWDGREIKLNGAGYTRRRGLPPAPD